ncbi:MAG: hypothetical protein OXI76_05130 [Gemmatimonadota bacterium]|nr:hypothetical protein [Gemmatimonadota bacterium]
MPNHRARALLLASAIAGAALGCEAPADPDLITVSDSAGTRIVTYASLDDEAFPAIEFEPGVDTIGAVDGPDEYFFRWIVSAELAPDGIVTADHQDYELKHFDRNGRFVSRIGGEGEGPGEFEALDWVQSLGDSLFFVWDGRNNRLTRARLTEAGLSHESSVPGPWSPAISPIGVFAPVRIAVDNARMIPVGDRGSLSDPFQVIASVVNLDEDPSAERLLEIAAVVAEPHFVSRDGMFAPLLFPTGHDFFFGDGVLWVQDGMKSEFRRVRVEGMLELVVRLPPERPVADQDINEFREANLRRAAGSEAMMRRALDEVPYPSVVPSLREMAVDEEAGIVWVTGFTTGEEPAPWYLFDSLGCPIGRVTVPGGNPPLDIAGRRIVVRDRDELDVERILIHRLAELPSDRAGRAATACPR